MIRRATTADVEQIAPLFQHYHQFYQQSSTLEACRCYLNERLMNSESVIFLATVDEDIVGFTQLYPGFSSLSMKRSFVLYDLFVEPRARRTGIAQQLMQAAEDYARQQQACELSLQTAHSNAQAQALYEKFGFQREDAFYTYYKTLI